MTEPSTEQSNPDTIAKPALFPSGGAQDTASPFDLTQKNMSNQLRVEVCDGKYTIIQDKQGRVTALRYGEPWNRDLVGDNLVLGMAYEIDGLREQIRSFQTTPLSLAEPAPTPSGDEAKQQSATLESSNGQRPKP